MMIIGQLSCVVSIAVAYILSYNMINHKRVIILAIIAVANMLALAIYYKDIDLENSVINWSDIIMGLAITLLGFIIIIVVNYVFLKPFSRKKLNDKIIKFTKKANPNLDLEMMAGDLTFLGEVNDMESNSQFKQLLEQKFKRIKIIAKPPTNYIERVRIGKLFDMLKNTSLEIKFYNEDNFSDLRLRFRCITLGDGTRATINIYKFVAEKEYITEELYSSSSNSEQKKRQKVFNELWNVYWKALLIDGDILQKCRDDYEKYIA